jgi:hypothetical protein
VSSLCQAPSSPTYVEDGTARVGDAHGRASRSLSHVAPRLPSPSTSSGRPYPLRRGRPASAQLVLRSPSTCAGAPARGASLVTQCVAAPPAPARPAPRGPFRSPRRSPTLELLLTQQTASLPLCSLTPSPCSPAVAITPPDREEVGKRRGQVRGRCRRGQEAILLDLNFLHPHLH